MYDRLPLPWEVTPSAEAAFPKSLYVRHEWNRDGKLADGEDEFWVGTELPLAYLIPLFGTASPVTRWREANPEKVGTDEDAVTVTINRMMKALGVEPGTNPKDVKVRLGTSQVLLLFGRSDEA